MLNLRSHLLNCNRTQNPELKMLNPQVKKVMTKKRILKKRVKRLHLLISKRMQMQIQIPQLKKVMVTKKKILKQKGRRL